MTGCTDVDTIVLTVFSMGMRVADFRARVRTCRNATAAVIGDENQSSMKSKRMIQLMQHLSSQCAFQTSEVRPAIFYGIYVELLQLFCSQTHAGKDEARNEHVQMRFE